MSLHNFAFSGFGVLNSCCSNQGGRSSCTSETRRNCALDAAGAATGGGSNIDFCSRLLGGKTGRASVWRWRATAAQDAEVSAQRQQMASTGPPMSPLARGAKVVHQNSESPLQRSTSTGSNCSSSTGLVAAGANLKAAALPEQKRRTRSANGRSTGASLKPQFSLRSSESSNSSSNTVGNVISKCASRNSLRHPDAKAETPTEPAEYTQQHQQTPRSLVSMSPVARIRGAPRARAWRAKPLVGPCTDGALQGPTPSSALSDCPPRRSDSAQRKAKQQRSPNGAPLPSLGASTAAARGPSSRRRKIHRSGKHSSTAAAPEQQSQVKRVTTKRGAAAVPVRRRAAKADTASSVNVNDSSSPGSPTSKSSSSSSNGSDSEYDEEAGGSTRRKQQRLLKGTPSRSQLLSRSLSDSFSVRQQQGSPVLTGAAAATCSSSSGGTAGVLVKGGLIASLTQGGSPLREGLGLRRKAASLLQLAEASPITTQQHQQPQLQQTNGDTGKNAVAFSVLSDSPVMLQEGPPELQSPPVSRPLSELPVNLSGPCGEAAVVVREARSEEKEQAESKSKVGKEQQQRHHEQEQQQQQTHQGGGAVVSLLRSFMKPFVRLPEEQHHQEEQQPQQEKQQQQTQEHSGPPQEQQEDADTERDVWFDAVASQQQSRSASSIELHQQVDAVSSSKSSNSRGSSPDLSAAAENAPIPFEGRQVLLQLIEVRECQKDKKTLDRAVRSPAKFVAVAAALCCKCLPLLLLGSASAFAACFVPLSPAGASRRCLCG